MPGPTVRLYDAAAQLGDADYRADRGVFFRSMHGTLNHLLTADWVWMHRFTGEGPSPDRLDTIQHERLADLRAAREAQDRRIAAYIDSLDEARLAGSIRYRRIRDARRIRPAADAGARSFLQPPDPPSRPGAFGAVQLRPARPGARSAGLSARGGRGLPLKDGNLTGRGHNCSLDGNLMLRKPRRRLSSKHGRQAMCSSDPREDAVLRAASSG